MSKIMGLEVVLGEEVPQGEIWFCNSEKKIVGKIVDIAKPDQPVESCREAFEKWQPLHGSAGTNGEFDAFLLTQREAFTAGWNARPMREISCTEKSYDSQKHEPFASGWIQRQVDEAKASIEQEIEYLKRQGDGSADE